MRFLSVAATVPRTSSLITTAQSVLGRRGRPRRHGWPRASKLLVTSYGSWRHEIPTDVNILLLGPRPKLAIYGGWPRHKWCTAQHDNSSKFEGLSWKLQIHTPVRREYRVSNLCTKLLLLKCRHHSRTLLTGYNYYNGGSGGSGGVGQGYNQSAGSGSGGSGGGTNAGNGGSGGGGGGSWK